MFTIHVSGAVCAEDTGFYFDKAKLSTLEFALSAVIRGFYGSALSVLPSCVVAEQLTVTRELWEVA